MGANRIRHRILIRKDYGATPPQLTEASTCAPKSNDCSTHGNEQEKTPPYLPVENRQQTEHPYRPHYHNSDTHLLFLANQPYISIRSSSRVTCLISVVLFIPAFSSPRRFAPLHLTCYCQMCFPFFCWNVIGLKQ